MFWHFIYFRTPDVNDTFSNGGLLGEHCLILYVVQGFRFFLTNSSNDLSISILCEPSSSYVVEVDVLKRPVYCGAKNPGINIQTTSFRLMCFNCFKKFPEKFWKVSVLKGSFWNGPFVWISTKSEFFWMLFSMAAKKQHLRAGSDRLTLVEVK